MALVLKRVTTEFIPTEDRVRLSGETENGPVVIWVTRRLLGLLLPVLFQRLDNQFASVMPEHRETLQEFAQQAARDSLEKSDPVMASDDGTVMLAISADISGADYGVTLIFRDESNCAFNFPLASETLRQWLQILYLSDRQAEWNLSCWPAWLTGENDSPLDPMMALH